MARPLRIEGAGLWYHVMSRGNAGNAVFLDTNDYRAFLARMASLSEQLQIETHAYALMQNHVHLFVRTRQANLSTFMQRLLSGYTTWHHCAHGTYGHLFQGRYKALVVERNAYAAAISRYIHLNPVRVEACHGMTFAQKQAMLRDYAWSSYRAMIGLGAAEGGLVTKDTLERHEGTLRERQAAYAAFVEQGLLQDLDDPHEEARAQIVLGRDRLVDRIRRIVCRRKEGDHEAARMRKRLLARRLADVLAHVANAYNVDIAELTKAKRGRVRREARQVALWLARRVCAGAMTTRQIGKHMGGISGASVSVADTRLTKRMQQDKKLKCQCIKLLDMLIDSA